MVLVTRLLLDSGIIWFWRLHLIAKESLKNSKKNVSLFDQNFSFSFKEPKEITLNPAIAPVERWLICLIYRMVRRCLRSQTQKTLENLGLSVSAVLFS